MKDLMKDVDSAFRMISSIPVSGDAVDVVAAARAKLRGVYARLEEMQNKENDTSEVT